MNQRVGPATILVIEDDDDISRLVALVLTEAGHRVLTRHDGSDAAAVVREEGVDLAIIDLGLPGMDGFQVQAAIQQGDDLAVPVVFLTARTDPESLVEGLGAGALDYIRKPFATDELVARIEVALRVKQSQDKLQAHAAAMDDQARIDPVTGGSNRRHIQDRLVEELSQARRSHRPLSVLIGDLDGFKQVNDKDGHIIGDRLLARVDAVLCTTLRPHELVGRWGGDEFVVVLPGTDEGQARKVALRLSDACAADPDLESHGVTITWGAATMSGPSLEDLVEDLIGAADRDLLAAKRSRG